MSQSMIPTTRSVPFARLLANHGDRVAIITPEAAVSYRDLAARVAELASVLGEQRRLVLLTGANRLDAVVAYLAALAGGHPVLLAPADRPASVEALVAGTTRMWWLAMPAGGGGCGSAAVRRSISCTPTWRCCCRPPGGPDRRLVRLSHEPPGQRRSHRHLPEHPSG